MHYYSRDLALVHDRGFGQHADRCAPGILELLVPRPWRPRPGTGRSCRRGCER